MGQIRDIVGTDQGVGTYQGRGIHVSSYIHMHCDISTKKSCENDNIQIKIFCYGSSQNINNGCSFDPSHLGVSNE